MSPLRLGHHDGTGPQVLHRLPIPSFGAGGGGEGVGWWLTALQGSPTTAQQCTGCAGAGGCVEAGGAHAHLEVPWACHPRDTHSDLAVSPSQPPLMQAQRAPTLLLYLGVRGFRIAKCYPEAVCSFFGQFAFLGKVGCLGTVVRARAARSFVCWALEAGFFISRLLFGCERTPPPCWRGGGGRRRPRGWGKGSLPVR